MYFLQLTLSPSSTVTAWGEGLAFVGWYKGSKISLNFSDSAAAWLHCLPFHLPWWCLYQLSSLWVYTFVNTKYLDTASSPLSSNLFRSCCSSFVWSQLNWCSQNPQDESSATNRNKHRTCRCFFPVPFPSLSFPNFISFTSLWEQGRTMARERANVPFALGQARAADGMTSSQRTRVCLCIVNVVEGDPQQPCSVMGWGGGLWKEFVSQAICRYRLVAEWQQWLKWLGGWSGCLLPARRQVWWTKVWWTKPFSWGFFGEFVCIGEMRMEASASELLWQQNCSGRCWVAAGPLLTSPCWWLLKWLVRCWGSSTSRWWRRMKCKQ